MDPQVWVPLVSGFGGALLGGAASLLGMLLSLHHSRKLDEIRWQREYRTRFDQEARQAIERFLSSLPNRA